MLRRPFPLRCVSRTQRSALTRDFAR